ncbi:carbohydrate ABC transporter permease [Halosimplex salinum]|uniref:carbohydrate ABC transporter permease n=1 Tax=Halosimplex salinum TaxID=1710538 RepID=UPI000F4625A7|nr:carbohydrate ABC transporter permease [Halosimplex salinum]
MSDTSTPATDGELDGSDDARAADRPGALERIDASRVALYGFLIGLLAVYMVPIESGLVTSIKTSPTGVSETLPYMPPLLPETLQFFTTEKWQTAFDALSRGLVSSALYAVPATIISAFAGSLAAYGLTQATWKERYKAPILALFVAGIFIPLQAVLVPLSQFWSNIVNVADLLGFVWALGINDDYAGIVEMIVTHVAYGIPICTVLFRSYYKNMSEEMIESARLDGATMRGVYRRIVLPLSTPMFAVVLIYQFTQIWNDLLFALILISSSASPAAPVVLILAGLGQSMEGQDFPLRMAGAFIAALPTLAVYVAFGEEFAEGVAS